MQRKVLITNPHGLHMRPSAAFVEAAGRFQSTVTVTHNGQTVNGKSLWDLLLLAAMPGSELLLEVDGPDAPAALETLARVLAAVPEDPPLTPPADLPQRETQSGPGAGAEGR